MGLCSGSSIRVRAGFHFFGANIFRPPRPLLAFEFGRVSPVGKAFVSGLRSLGFQKTEADCNAGDWRVTLQQTGAGK